MTDKQVKRRARSMVQRAVADGWLPKPNQCPHCQEFVMPWHLEAHHESYAPGGELDVIWLCHECHDLEHDRLRAYTREAHSDGRVAWLTCKPLAANPHPPLHAGREREAWEAGWREMGAHDARYRETVERRAA